MAPGRLDTGWLLERLHPTERSRSEFIAACIGVNEKTIQTNVRALEQAGLIRRELRRTAAGDYDSDIYHPDGLVERIRAVEPDFAKVRDAKAKLREAQRSAETSPHRRVVQK